jgi:formylglycine-generating enzyme required for sulfatase activity
MSRNLERFNPHDYKFANISFKQPTLALVAISFAAFLVINACAEATILSDGDDDLETDFDGPNPCLGAAVDCDPGKCKLRYGKARCVCPDGYHVERYTCEPDDPIAETETEGDGDRTDSDRTDSGTLDGDITERDEEHDIVEYEGTDIDALLDELGLMWAFIPGGTFTMGCSPYDSLCSDDEKPSHRVTVKSFMMTRTEITQAQYRAIKSRRPSYFQPPEYEECLDCPVERVNWFHAKQFCKEIDARLPTEAEWEYAARAGTTTKYTCGDEQQCLLDVAWFHVNSGYITHPVGQKEPNIFGLHDMLGNVWEWVEDCSHYGYRGAPSDGSEWDDVRCSTYRVLRGGGFGGVFYASSLRVSERYSYFPHSAFRHIGFRCVRNVSGY